MTIVAAACLLPVDGYIADICKQFQKGGSLQLGGDVRRTLEFLQQFGDLASSIIVGVCILLLDPTMRRRMFDWIVAAVATSIAVWILKMLIGRARPRLGAGASNSEYISTALTFTGPTGTFPLPHKGDNGLIEVIERHSWEFWHGVSDLWSMPSSHTSAAAVLAVALSTMYPKLRVLVWPLAAIVGINRVLVGAHYPSDVVLGAGVGFCIATLAMHGKWGQRLTRRESHG